MERIQRECTANGDAASVSVIHVCACVCVLGCDGRHRRGLAVDTQQQLEL